MKLYHHQEKIIQDRKAKTGLFLGTGSGKTLIALMMAEGRSLIIAPKTQVEDRNWEREIEKRPSLRTIHRDTVVISKETFRRDWEKLEKFDTVIVDEAHTCLGATPNVRWKNKEAIPKTSQLFEALDGYIARAKPKQLYLCTATIIRSPMTVWAAAKLLGKNWDWWKFRSTFYVRLPMSGREVFAPKNDSDTKDRLARAVRKIGYTGQLSDYIDMPQQIFKTDFVELTPEQKKKIKTLPLDFPDPLVLLGKTHCVENGILNGDEFNESESFSNKKIDKLVDYAIEFPQMIVFARYTAQIDQIEAAMLKIGKKVFRLTGDTKDRGNVIFEAKNTAEYVFIAQSAVSAGWELGECPVMIFASLDWSLVNYVQSLGRISRINNPKRNLYIFLISHGGVDEKVYESVVENKMDFHLRMYEKD